MDRVPELGQHQGQEVGKDRRRCKCPRMVSRWNKSTYHSKPSTRPRSMNCSRLHHCNLPYRELRRDHNLKTHIPGKQDRQASTLLREMVLGQATHQDREREQGPVLGRELGYVPMGIRCRHPEYLLRCLDTLGHHCKLPL